jgi:hypothetical protein
MELIRRNHWITLLAALLVLAPLRSHAATPDSIKPPFGLQWGESSERIETLLKNVKARIVDKHPVGDREVWTVEGLQQAGLKRSVFYFRAGMLIEVELQYQSDDWDTEKYDDFMSQIRRRLELRYGVGQLIARTKLPHGDVMQTLVGYKWNQDDTSIELFYFEAENAAQSFRTVSVHYRSY